MLKEIEGTGFKGVALEGGIATRSKNFTPAAIDVERLPAKCRVAFDEAGKQKKLVILDVHGPG